MLLVKYNKLGSLICEILSFDSLVYFSGQKEGLVLCVKVLNTDAHYKLIGDEISPANLACELFFSLFITNKDYTIEQLNEELKNWNSKNEEELTHAN